VTFPDGTVKSYDLPSAAKSTNTKPNVLSNAKPKAQLTPVTPQSTKKSAEERLQEKLDFAKQEGNTTKVKELEKYQVDQSRVKKATPPPAPANVKTALNNVLPEACKLIDIKWLEKLVEAKEDILVTNSTSAKNPNTNSCFFRWSNDLMPNSGIFLQIVENPVPDEVSNYAHYFVKGKLESGETDMSGNKYEYIPYKTVGIAGAYSAEQGNYFWQVSEERVFMLAFNLGLSSKKEKRYADAIAKHVMSRYKG